MHKHSENLYKLAFNHYSTAKVKKCSDAPSRAQLFPNSILLPAHPGRLPQGFQEPAWTRKDHWSLQQLLSLKGVWFETGKAWQACCAGGSH